MDLIGEEDFEVEMRGKKQVDKADLKGTVLKKLLEAGKLTEGSLKQFHDAQHPDDQRDLEKTLQDNLLIGPLDGERHNTIPNTMRRRLLGAEWQARTLQRAYWRRKIDEGSGSNKSVRKVNDSISSELSHFGVFEAFLRGFFGANFDWGKGVFKKYDISHALLILFAFLRQRNIRCRTMGHIFQVSKHFLKVEGLVTKNGSSRHQEIIKTYKWINAVLRDLAALESKTSFFLIILTSFFLF